MAPMSLTKLKKLYKQLFDAVNVYDCYSSTDLNLMTYCELELEKRGIEIKTATTVVFVKKESKK